MAPDAVPFAVQPVRLFVDRLLILVPPALAPEWLTLDERMLLRESALVVAPVVCASAVLEGALEDQASA
jgi:hypothetical protein